MKILIIGGTGSLGSCLAHIYREHPITIFSRDELKQYEMQKAYPSFEYVLGDIRDRDRVSEVFRELKPDVVFHTAALKHVDKGEKFVEEFIKTNVIGTQNVYHACKFNKVEQCVYFSTDKAVLPINAYGMSKGLGEHLWLKDDLEGFYVFRWGNVFGSRGSVIHQFIKTIKEEKKAYLTHEDMTRFFITLNDAVKFVDDILCEEKKGLHIPPMKSTSIKNIIELIAKKLWTDVEIVETDIRPGEKIHECLISNHDYCLRSDNAPKLTDDEINLMIDEVLNA